MTIHKTTCSKGKSKTEQRRLRLRDWLEIKIADPNYPGLEWVNKEKKIFRIPWKHGARHGWREEEDARLFREWSDHTGATPRDVKQHKANFRCALNSLRDVTQVHELNKQKGNDAYRVYQMLPKKNSKQGSYWIRKRKQGLHSDSSKEAPPSSAPSPLSSLHESCDLERHSSTSIIQKRFKVPSSTIVTYPMFPRKVLNHYDKKHDTNSSPTSFPQTEIDSFVSSSNIIGSSNIVAPVTSTAAIDMFSVSAFTKDGDPSTPFNTAVWNVVKDANDAVLENNYTKQNNFPKLYDEHIRGTLSSSFLSTSSWDSGLCTPVDACHFIAGCSGGFVPTNVSSTTYVEDCSADVQLPDHFSTFSPTSETSYCSLKPLDSFPDSNNGCNSGFVSPAPTPTSDAILENENISEKTFSILHNTSRSSEEGSGHQIISENEVEDYFVSHYSPTSGGRLPSASTLLSPWSMSNPGEEFKSGLQLMSLC